MNDFDVSKSEDGRILVMTDTYAASFVNGAWHRKLLFKPEDIRDNFETVENQAEAKRIHDEAVKALQT
ncbi:MAG TPA: hypothetical protein V6C72_19225 [Chroococcales cyanobacterium]